MNTIEPTTAAPAAEATDKPTFHITDEPSANWLLRKLANLEAEKQRVKAQAVEIVAGLERDAAGLRHRYEAELQEFAREQLARRGNRTKTLRLLQGTLSFRTVPAGLRLSDPNAALPCARSLGAIVTREELDMVAYRQAAERALTQTGELLPGVEAVPERESFSIRFGKEPAGDG